MPSSLIRRLVSSWAKMAKADGIAGLSFRRNAFVAFVIRDWVIVLLRSVRIILLFIMGVRLGGGMRVGHSRARVGLGLLVRGLPVPGRDRLLALRRGWACKEMCVV